MSLPFGQTGPIIPDVHKIAVVRANALGDFVFTLPALESLRAAYLGAEIVLLALPWHREFLRGRPGPVDRVVPVPDGAIGDEREPSASATEIAHFFGAMRAERFDLALQLHGGGRNSNPFTLKLGAREAAGMRTPDAPPLGRWIPYIYFQSEVLRYLEVVGLVGAQPAALEPRICVTERDRAEATAVLSESSYGTAGLAVLHPGAGDPRRRWPAGKFAAIGRALAAAGARVVVTGTEAERGLVEAVVREMHAQGAEARALCGCLTLGGLAGLLSRAAVVVANDTGPLHLAMAVGAATVGIYWCFNLINGGPATRARHRPVSSWRLECPICGRNCMTDNCSHDASFVADVDVDEVLPHALDLLSAARCEPSSSAHLHSSPVQ